MLTFFTGPKIWTAASCQVGHSDVGSQGRFWRTIEVVVEDQAVDRARLVLDEEALAAEVVQVVLAEVQVVAAPHGLKDVVVVAPLDVPEELVALDQQAVGVRVGAVVVEVGLDLVLVEAALESVVGDRHVVAPDRRGPGTDVDGVVGAVADHQVVIDRHPGRRGLDVDRAALHLELGERDVAAGHASRPRSSRARVGGLHGHARGALGRVEAQPAVAAVGQADHGTRSGRAHRARGRARARHRRGAARRAGAGGHHRCHQDQHQDRQRSGQRDAIPDGAILGMGVLQDWIMGARPPPVRDVETQPAGMGLRPDRPVTLRSPRRTLRRGRDEWGRSTHRPTPLPF